MFVAWRHAHGRYFSVSSRQFARAIQTSHRHVVRLLDELERHGVIVLKKERRGTIPRTYAFTGKAFNETPSGDMVSPLTQNASGDMGDT